jgi:hypothetical protein
MENVDIKGVIMWIKDLNGNMVNMEKAEALAMVPEREESTVKPGEMVITGWKLIALSQGNTYILKGGNEDTVKTERDGIANAIGKATPIYEVK